MIIRCQLKNFIIWPIQHSKSLWSRNKNHYSPISLTSTTLSSHKRFCINIWIPSRSEQIFTSDTSIRSLLIHVNNGISSAKSFGEDNLSTNPASLSLQKKEKEERREKNGKKRNGKKKEGGGTSSSIQLPSWTESPSQRFNSRRWATSRRGANKTRLARPPISSISSTEDQRSIIGFFDVWESHLSFLTGGPTVSGKQKWKKKKK